MDMRTAIGLVETAQIITAFHGTTSPIEHNLFRGGTHFGSKLAAAHRIDELLEMHHGSWRHSSFDIAPCIYEVRLSISKPIELTDRGEWHLSEMVKDMIARGYIASAEEIGGDLHDWMLEQGYDAVVYTNTNEDAGSLSYIPFDSLQIKIVGVEAYTPSVG